MADSCRLDARDKALLEQWLDMIARFRERGWITEEEAAELRRQALDAVAD